MFYGCRKCHGATKILERWISHSCFSPLKLISPPSPWPTLLTFIQTSGISQTGTANDWAATHAKQRQVLKAIEQENATIFPIRLNRVHFHTVSSMMRINIWWNNLKLVGLNNKEDFFNYIFIYIYLLLLHSINLWD